MVTRAALLVWLTAAAAPAVELHLSHHLLERMLADQLFTEEGRRYVGGKRTRCNFAYLRDPRVQGGGGRLRILAKFTGRTSLDLLGRCVGLGDEFGLVITARPEFRGESIGLADVRVAGDGKSGFYISSVCAGIAHTLTRDFRYPIAAEVKRILEDPANLPHAPRKVTNFTVREIRVGVDDVVLDLDFQLTLK